MNEGIPYLVGYLTLGMERVAVNDTEAAPMTAHPLCSFPSPFRCTCRTFQLCPIAPIMATQAVAVAGLGSSMLRGHSLHCKALQGPLCKGKNASRLRFAPIRAAKLPRGVEAPKDEPKLPVPFWGFTKNAEVWNSRASLIGIFGIIIVEAIIGKGLLQTIGIDVGKGLDLPL